MYAFLSCNLRPERDSRRVDRLESLGVGRCRNGSCLRCCRLGCGGGENVGGLCSLKVAKAVASSRAISFQPGVVDFCCVSPGAVIILDFHEENSNDCDEGVHGGVFLCSHRQSKAPNPVGRDGFLICEKVKRRKTREVGGVAARMFGCGEDAASSCRCGHGASTGRKQRGCGHPQLNHNRRPRATRHGEGVRGGVSQHLKRVGRGVEGGVLFAFGRHRSR